jgi:hypothetical protein
MLLWLLTAVVFGHGGPPESRTLLWGSSADMTIVSSHGLLFEDEGWNWVCEELFGSTLPTDVVRTPASLLVGSTAGLVHSGNGCDWDWTPELIGTMVWKVAVDTNGSGRVWVATEAGLWWSDDHGSTATFAYTPDSMASVRSFVQLGDNAFMVFGFVDDQATAWRQTEDGWLSTAIEANGGQLHGLGADSSGNVYGRFPVASGTDELIRISTDGEASRVLETNQSIGAFISVDDAIVVSIDGVGTQVSTDAGDTWTPTGEQTFQCLVSEDSYIWGCPSAGSDTLWMRTTDDITSDDHQWETGPSFSTVSEPRCEDELPQCDAVWPQVAEELGLESTDTGEATATRKPKQTQSGCGSQAAMVFFPWGLLWIGRRRPSMRTQHHTHRHIKS